MSSPRRRTQTSRFGASRREGHDASGFYDRFAPPVVSSDSEINQPLIVDEIFAADARKMDEVADASVALVITSPPYFAGKEYEEALGEGHIPGSYVEYLAMLGDVFRECERVLEPGGRMAINVANLGRKPYRSLSSDVIAILQDDLGMLLRGEIVWLKQRGASGSCAWGSFQRASNPVLRDLTERVVVASKGRFDRALSTSQRAKDGHPSTSTITRDEFMDATLDVWEIPPERASRVGHPAPFPVELPARLIDLYTYEGDVVLDPFIGSGTTAVAAIAADRHFIGFETDNDYVELAGQRIEEAEAARRGMGGGTGTDQVDPLADVRGEGVAARELASIALALAGFVDVTAKPRPRHGVDLAIEAKAPDGTVWGFDVVGAFTAPPSGLARPDQLWRSIGRAEVLRQLEPDLAVAVLTVDQPRPGSASARHLAELVGDDRPVRAVLDLTSTDLVDRLRQLSG